MAFLVDLAFLALALRALRRYGRVARLKRKPAPEQRRRFRKLTDSKAAIAQW